LQALKDLIETAHAKFLVDLITQCGDIGNALEDHVENLPLSIAPAQNVIDRSVLSGIEANARSYPGHALAVVPTQGQDLDLVAAAKAQQAVGIAANQQAGQGAGKGLDTVGFETSGVASEDQSSGINRIDLRLKNGAYVRVEQVRIALVFGPLLLDPIEQLIGR